MHYLIASHEILYYWCCWTFIIKLLSIFYISGLPSGSSPTFCISLESFVLLFLQKLDRFDQINFMKVLH